MELVVSGDKYELFPGDVVVFRGDQKHSYANRGAKVAVAYSAVILGPVQSLGEVARALACAILLAQAKARAISRIARWLSYAVQSLMIL